MTTTTEGEFTFEYEASNGVEKSFHVTFEVDLSTGHSDFEVFADETCSHDITQIIQDIDLELFKEIESECTSHAEVAWEEALEEDPELTKIDIAMDEAKDAI